jgi:hypothetical protein
MTIFLLLFAVASVIAKCSIHLTSTQSADSILTSKQATLSVDKTTEIV